MLLLRIFQESSSLSSLSEKPRMNSWRLTLEDLASLSGFWCTKDQVGQLGKFFVSFCAPLVQGRHLLICKRVYASAKGLNAKELKGKMGISGLSFQNNGWAAWLTWNHGTEMRQRSCQPSLPSVLCHTPLSSTWPPIHLAACTGSPLHTWGSPPGIC